MRKRYLAWMVWAALLTACGGSSGGDGPPPSGPLTYLALGASDAAGIGASTLENGYVYRIERALEEERAQPVELTNTGIPGALADDILDVLRLALLIGTRPDMVTLWSGANDLTQGRSPEDFWRDLESMLALLRQETDALIFLGDLPDLSALPRFVADPDPDDERKSRALHGLARSLVNNMVVGVSEGYKKSLEINGTGYRAQAKGKGVEMSLGFSHTIQVDAPEGISFTVEKPTLLHVEGIDKQLVGQVASNIRRLRPPEPYKGKGVKYVDERIRRKAGKAGK